MTGRMRLSGKLLMVAGVVLAAFIGLVLFSGCRREQPHDHSSHEGHDHAAAAPAKVEAALAAEQTACPIMGGAVNKAVFVEYQGKKVYFCCKGCDHTFQQNPEKYLAKLPQFQD